MAKLGRPRALDEIKRREVCALVAAGCGLPDAARYVGCAPSTIRREALRNEDFHEALRRAEMAGQLESLRTIRKAAASNWRAAAWLLERTHPERFAKQDVKTLKPDEVDAVIDRLAETIAEEIDDQATQGRVYRRLLAAARNSMRELLAAQRPRRDPRRARRMLGLANDVSPADDQTRTDSSLPTKRKTPPPGA